MKVLIRKVRFAGWIWKAQAPTGQRLALRNMTKSELRSLFELSQKLRPQDADRFKKHVPSRKTASYRPKTTLPRTRIWWVRRANLDPIYTDRFAAVSVAPPLSITIPSSSMCLSKQRARKGYRRLPVSFSNRIVFALIITINSSVHSKRAFLRCHYLE